MKNCDLLFTLLNNCEHVAKVSLAMIVEASKSEAISASQLPTVREIRQRLTEASAAITELENRMTR